MKENELPVLKITNIDWDRDYEELEKLPKEVQVKWDSKDWTQKQVSDWVSIKYDWVLNDLKIIQAGSWKNDSCGCC